MEFVWLPGRFDVSSFKSKRLERNGLFESIGIKGLMETGRREQRKDNHRLPPTANLLFLICRYLVDKINRKMYKLTSSLALVLTMVRLAIAAPSSSASSAIVPAAANFFKEALINAEKFEPHSPNACFPCGHVCCDGPECLVRRFA